MKARFTTHAAAVAAGAAIAFGMSWPENPRGAERTDEARAAAAHSTRVPRESRTRGSSAATKLRGEDLRRAWDAVATTEHSLQERIFLQSGLLERWAEVDLEAALDAAMAEAWDNDLGWVQWGSVGHPLVDSFDRVFADRPLDTWALITSGKYGVGTQILRRQWLSALSSKNGPLVISMLGELPPSLHEYAINSCMNEARAQPDKLEAIRSGLASYPAGQDRDKWLRIAEANTPGVGDADRN